MKLIILILLLIILISCTPKQSYDFVCKDLGCPEGTKVVAAKTGIVFYQCFCQSAQNMKKENLRCFNSEDEALKEGLRPSQKC